MNKVFSFLDKQNYAVKISNGNHSLVADEPLEHGGGNVGFTPVDLLLSSLAACTSITLRMYADRKQWNLENVETEIESTIEGELFTIYRKIKLIGVLNEEQNLRLLQIANACPVHKILNQQVAIKTSIV
jgi:putative redox protein